jgi:hypothetical protein
MESRLRYRMHCGDSHSRAWDLSIPQCPDHYSWHGLRQTSAADVDLHRSVPARAMRDSRRFSTDNSEGVWPLKSYLSLRGSTTGDNSNFSKELNRTTVYWRRIELFKNERSIPSSESHFCWDSSPLSWGSSSTWCMRPWKKWYCQVSKLRIEKIDDETSPFKVS